MQHLAIADPKRHCSGTGNGNVATALKSPFLKFPWIRSFKVAENVFLMVSVSFLKVKFAYF
jgi:hypothetical protein